MKPKRILMPTDFSDCAGAALALAVSWAEQFRAELHLLHVVELRTAGQAGLIVIGSQGLRGFERFLLGSVSERVVRAAPCPVLVTRPTGTGHHHAEHAHAVAI